MNVTDCLEHARVCAQIADRLTGEDKVRLLSMADAWLALADDNAKKALNPNAATIEFSINRAPKPSPRR
jgi:hypothetical protein